MIIPVLISIIVVALFVLILMALMSRGKNKGSKDGIKTSSTKGQKKGKSVQAKDFEKKLSHNPHDVPALEGLGDIYYEEQNWEKAYSTYKTLYDISSAHLEIDVAKVTQRMGISAYHLNRYDEAFNALMLSSRRNSESFETNYYLAKVLQAQEKYDKAILCYKRCRALKPETTDVNEGLGLCFYKSQKYRDSLPFLKKFLDEHPDNKEMLYYMAVAMDQSGMGEKALKVFMHLRANPDFGPQACLEAGKIHERTKDYSSAIQDYEIGMKHNTAQEQIMVQIKYRCANCYIATNNIAKGLVILKDIQATRSGYKDVDALVTRYSELNQNQNLQAYMMASTSDFVALCRKFIGVYFKGAFVKIENITVESQTVEIVCFVESNKWEAKNMFRFYRNQAVVGDIYVREFHSKMRDTKCDNGYCVTMGVFTDAAHNYTEGRPIDLIEKDTLTKLLKKISVV